jgi:uncharacterized membrane protein
MSREGILAEGPVHKLVVEFDENRFRGEIWPELDRLKELGIIRVIDLIGVRKDTSGAIAVISASDLPAEEAEEFGSVVGALIGLGFGGAEGAEEGARVGAERLRDGHFFDPKSVPTLAAMIPDNSSLFIVLFEHTWAVQLRNKISRAGGSVVQDELIGAEELIRLGRSGAVQGNGH